MDTIGHIGISNKQKSFKVESMFMISFAGRKKYIPSDGQGQKILYGQIDRKRVFVLYRAANF